MKRITLSLAALVATVSSLRSDEFTIKLRQTPGVEAVQNNCAACHSTDYIVMNSPFLDAKGWAAEVAKMINAFGAPVGEADAKVIVEYLAANYGG